MIAFSKIVTTAFSLSVGLTILFVSFQVTLDRQVEAKQVESQQIDQPKIETVYEEIITTTPQPTITPRITSPQEIRSYAEEIFTEREARAWILYVIGCESGFNPRAISSSGQYHGLLQFVPRTFYGNGGRNLYDYQDQIKVAKKMYDLGQQYQWPACTKKFLAKNK